MNPEAISSGKLTFESVHISHAPIVFPPLTAVRSQAQDFFQLTPTNLLSGRHSRYVFLCQILHVMILAHTQPTHIPEGGDRSGNHPDYLGRSGLARISHRYGTNDGAVCAQCTHPGHRGLAGPAPPLANMGREGSYVYLGEYQLMVHRRRIRQTRSGIGAL